MSEGLNEVRLFGNLGADPELRTTQGGDAILKLRIATAERYQDKNKEWQEHTEWHNVTVWGKRAESLHRILSKGSPVLVVGALRTSSYDNKEGQKVWRTEIKAHNIILAGGRNSPRGETDTPQGSQGSRPTSSDDPMPF